MMQQSHLTAWQAHAPWPKRSQIEQDLRLSQGVAAIFQDDVLGQHLARRGGTVLHKAHLAPAARYSAPLARCHAHSSGPGDLGSALRFAFLRVRLHHTHTKTSPACIHFVPSGVS